MSAVGGDLRRRRRIALLLVSLAAAPAFGCSGYGCADSKRVEPGDGPDVANARAKLAEAGEEGDELAAARQEEGTDVLAAGSDWQAAKAAALRRTRVGLIEMDRRLAQLADQVAARAERTALTAAERARVARREVDHRIELLESSNETSWDEAQLQLENAIDTMNEAIAQAETALSRRP